MQSIILDQLTAPFTFRSKAQDKRATLSRVAHGIEAPT
jgi:hypothetical protein